MSSNVFPNHRRILMTCMDCQDQSFFKQKEIIDNRTRARCQACGSVALMVSGNGEDTIMSSMAAAKKLGNRRTKK